MDEEEGVGGYDRASDSYYLLNSPSSRSSGSSFECRICGDGSREDMGDLISPCKCKGSLARVHTDCLEMWILARPNGNNQRDLLVCEICNGNYGVSLSRRLLCDFEHMCTWSTIVHIVEGITLTLCISCVFYIFVQLFPKFESETNRSGITLIIFFLLVLLVLSLCALHRLFKRWYQNVSALTIV